MGKDSDSWHIKSEWITELAFYQMRQGKSMENS